MLSEESEQRNSCTKEGFSAREFGEREKVNRFDMEG